MRLCLLFTRQVGRLVKTHCRGNSVVHEMNPPYGGFLLTATVKSSYFMVGFEQRIEERLEVLEKKEEGMLRILSLLGVNRVLRWLVLDPTQRDLVEYAEKGLPIVEGRQDELRRLQVPQQ
ncbi:MAG: hypothetical protein HYS86_01725 [Candidatus Chisholmbacteria bacterium]|nr:hypothetical protein [Candidatus Chisholmbacteria bacterium]